MEGIFWITSCVFPLILGLFIIGGAALVFGILLLFRSRNVQDAARVRLLSFALITVGALPFILLILANWRYVQNLASGRLYFPQVVTGASVEITPMLAAREAAGAEEIGFTPVEPDARVEIERTFGKAPNYDVMLHVYGSTSRTVAFKQEGDSFLWVGEQEIFEGPNEYFAEYSYQHEEIVMTFDIVNLSGASLNRLYFTYRGDDPRLANDQDLTYEEVALILIEWGAINAPSP